MSMSLSFIQLFLDLFVGSSPAYPLIVFALIGSAAVYTLRMTAQAEGVDNAGMNGRIDTADTGDKTAAGVGIVYHDSRRIISADNRSADPVTVGVDQCFALTAEAGISLGLGRIMMQHHIAGGSVVAGNQTENMRIAGTVEEFDIIFGQRFAAVGIGPQISAVD